MWFIQKYRPSNTFTILFVTLLIISCYLTFNPKTFLQLPLNKFHENDQAKLSPTDYLHVRLNLTSNTAICQSNDNLIIYILSTASNFERRKIIRSTWGSPLISACVVFILGQIPVSDSDQIRINKEKRRFKDIVQIDHTESYAAVIYKEIAVLQWSSHFYPSIKYLFKTDDDLIIDSILISSIAQLLVTNLPDKNSYIAKHRLPLMSSILSSDRSTFFRGGWSMDTQPTMRGNQKFGVSEEVWPHPVLPLYCSGFGWFMSSDVRNKLLTTSYTYPLNKTVWIGDVFLSGFLASAAHVKCTAILIDFEQTFTANCSCLMAQNPMLTVCSSTIHGGDRSDETVKYNEYIKAWKVIQQRHSLLNITVKDIIKDC